MNLLYISCLSGNYSHGLTYSVPAQIESQSKIDNVYWLNLNPEYKNINTSHVECNKIEEPLKFKLSNLAPPFNKPDLVIFEGVYFISYWKLAISLKKLNIPYIIVPRSSLTKQAQQKKLLKKIIANFLFFNSFVKNAAAIQYLTKDEYLSSGQKWNNNYLIIPNGINKKQTLKKYSCKKLKGIFIGRLDIYQKGIDLLIEACYRIKNEMKSAGCSIDIYGPEENGSKRKIRDLIYKYELYDYIKVFDEIYHEEKEKILLNCDFFILTSRFEGHPMGLIEALSYGIPCVVTKGTNMIEEIETENAGWTAENDVGSIALAIKQLFNQKGILNKKGQNALNLSKKYNWDFLAKESNRLYTQLLD
ncbi:hypothetical protein MTP04_13560 [Lysinibacillus sp. PLM2]|nr:hypothetical protein MTP04_13560 [Lysinibacillus sp. PLM2]